MTSCYFRNAISDFKFEIILSYNTTILFRGHSFLRIESYSDNALSIKDSGFYISLCISEHFSMCDSAFSCWYFLLEIWVWGLSNSRNVIIVSVSGIVGTSISGSNGFKTSDTISAQVSSMIIDYFNLYGSSVNNNKFFFTNSESNIINFSLFHCSVSDFCRFVSILFVVCFCLLTYLIRLTDSKMHCSITKAIL